MKIVFLLTLLLPLSVMSQTLKITGVDGSDDKLYNMAAKRGLDKNMILKVYDNSITVTIGDMSSINLKQLSSSTYRKTESGNSETITYTLTLSTTASFITSAVFKLEIVENGGKQRYGWYTITGKRF